MNRLRQILADLGAAFTRLPSRERTLVVAGGGAAIFLVLFLVSVSVSSGISRREARIKTKSVQLEEVNKLTGGYRMAEQQRADLERRLRGNQGVRLFTLMDELSKKQGLDIGGMNDKGSHPINDTKITESSVEVNFTRISLDKLVRFLTEIEASNSLVKITRLQIRPRPDEPVIDAWLVVSTYQLES